MITPMPHQLVFSDKCWDVLRNKGYVYLAGKPRSGKTYTAILTAEKSSKINSVLVLTKKNARGGWHKFIDGNTSLKHKYYVTNYEQAKKLNKNAFDLVILDESHNLGTLGKPSKRILDIRKLCWDMPHIHLSGTAIVESPNSIFHQMYISKYTPFKFKNFYDFFRFYGKPYYIKIGAREIAQYDKADMDRLMPEINEFTVYMTQNDAGISNDLQAVDKLHYITLNDRTRALYNELQKHQIAKIPTGHTLVCDSVMKLRVSLHMLESGVAKINDEYIELGNTEKIDYIKETFGDTKDIGIMCHFIGERKLLEKHFKHANIYSSSAHAEGVDLSHLKHFIILSGDYSGAKFIQRRERIINTHGSNTLTVHHILVRGAISDQVYKRVSKKEDFNNSTYQKTFV
jgi:hypothetical protein